MSGVAKAVGSIFGGGKTPTPAPAPVAPTVDNSAAKLEAAAEEQRQASLRGRTSTMLTGGSGFEEAAGSTSKLMLGQ